MGRTNVYIDDELIERAMKKLNVTTKREAVDLALREVVGRVATVEEVRAMRGMGWDGDLDEIRGTDRVAELWGDK